MTTYIIKIEHIPGKAVFIYTLKGIKEIIGLGVMSDVDIDDLHMTYKARTYWQVHRNKKK